MRTFMIIAALFQSCVTEKSISITEFTTYDKTSYTTISLGKEMVYYNNFFLVSKYRNNERIETKIDSFVVGFIASKTYSSKTENIRLYFYKESSKTNLVAIEKNPREVDRYSNEHDLVYCYTVKLNGEKLREKFKNGDVIETTAKKIKTPKFKIIQR